MPQCWSVHLQVDEWILCPIQSCQNLKVISKKDSEFCIKIGHTSPSPSSVEYTPNRLPRQTLPAMTNVRNPCSIARICENQIEKSDEMKLLLQCDCRGWAGPCEFCCAYQLNHRLIVIVGCIRATTVKVWSPNGYISNSVDRWLDQPVEAIIASRDLLNLPIPH